MADTFWENDRLTPIMTQLSHVDRLCTAQAFSKPTKARTKEILEMLLASHERLEDFVSDVTEYAKKRGVKVE